MIKTIEEYSKTIFLLSHEAANSVRPHAPNDDPKFGEDGIGDQQWFAILQEYIYLALHLTARHYSSNFWHEWMNSNDSTEIIDDLIEICIDGSVAIICKDWPIDTKEKIKSECYQNFGKSMAEYKEYHDYFPEIEDDSPQKTLFWEFGKVVAATNHLENDIQCIIASEKAAVKLLKDLNIKQFVKQITT